MYNYKLINRGATQIPTSGGALRIRWPIMILLIILIIISIIMIILVVVVVVVVVVVEVLGEVVVVVVVVVVCLVDRGIGEELDGRAIGRLPGAHVSGGGSLARWPSHHTGIYMCIYIYIYIHIIYIYTYAHTHNIYIYI